MTEDEKRQHRCCFVGHRPEKLDQSENEVKAWLNTEIDQAIGRGFTTFISGMAMGTDLWAAGIVLEKKKTNPAVHLIAATPFPTFPLKWSDGWKQAYQTVWEAADFRIAVSDSYSDDAFEKRNIWMVDRSNLVLACYNGGLGGTRNTLEYAKEKGVPIVVFSEENKSMEPYPFCLLNRLSPDGAWPDDIEIRLMVSFASLQTVKDIEAMEKRYKEGKKLQTIGDEMGVSRERIRQLIERSEKRLKGSLPFLKGEKTEDEKILKKEWLVANIKK